MTRNNIEVGIAMGSDSDLPIMEDASKCLDELGVGYELRIISAHRTPQKMIEYGEKAKERGLKTICLNGRSGGTMSELNLDSNLIIPSNTTARIQEAHINIIHIWCELIDHVIYKVNETN